MDSNPHWFQDRRNGAAVAPIADLKCFTNLKPNTHRRRRRDETVLSRRVGVDGVYMNWRRLRRIRRCERTTQPSAVTQFTTADGCVHTDNTTKLSPTSCEFVFTPPTRRDSTVSSRRCRRHVLGIMRSFGF